VLLLLLFQLTRTRLLASLAALLLGTLVTLVKNLLALLARLLPSLTALLLGTLVPTYS
jgi:hypothetical protein